MIVVGILHFHRSTVVSFETWLGVSLFLLPTLLMSLGYSAMFSKMDTIGVTNQKLSLIVMQTTNKVWISRNDFAFLRPCMVRECHKWNIFVACVYFGTSKHLLGKSTLWQEKGKITTSKKRHDISNCTKLCNVTKYHNFTMSYSAM